MSQHVWQTLFTELIDLQNGESEYRTPASVLASSIDIPLSPDVRSKTIKTHACTVAVLQPPGRKVNPANHNKGINLATRDDGY